MGFLGGFFIANLREGHTGVDAAAQLEAQGPPDRGDEGLRGDHQGDVQQEAQHVRLALLQAGRHGAAGPARLHAGHQEADGLGLCPRQDGEQRI